MVIQGLYHINRVYITAWLPPASEHHQCTLPANCTPEPHSQVCTRQLCQSRQIGFSSRSSTVLLQGLWGALHTEGKSQTSQVRITYRCAMLYGVERKSTETSNGFLSSSNCWPFPGHGKFLCLLPLFITLPLPGMSFPATLGLASNIPT